MRGEALPEGWEQELRARFRSRPEVKEALERMWPVLSGAELVNDLFGFAALVRSAADGVLDRRRAGLAAPAARDRDVATRRRGPKTTSRSSTKPTRCSGRSRPRGPRARRRAAAATRSSTARSASSTSSGSHGYADAATLARRFGEAPARTATETSFEPRTFGHVLVDEAQDLTAMQWRMLARRCPSGSMTLVGDPGQASRPGARRVVGRRARAPAPRTTRPASSRSRINYRTPAEVMDVAARLLAVAAPTVEPSRSVRSTGEYPRFVADRQPTTSSTTTAAHARAALDAHRNASR